MAINYGAEGVTGATIKGISLSELGISSGSISISADHLRGIKQKEREPYDRYGFPQIEKVIHNNPKTVVIWSDKTKTIVSCGEDAEFDEYVGFTAAVMKKLFGSNTKVKKIMKAKTVVSKKKIEKDKQEEVCTHNPEGCTKCIFGFSVDKKSDCYKFEIKK